MEVSALTHTEQHVGPARASALLRLQSDERLIALTRRGHHAAFEVLCSRYQSRLLSFCRHMLASKEDAEDVLQEVFAAAFNAVLADERPINVRRGCTGSPATARSTTFAAPPPPASTRWTSTSPRTASRRPTRSCAARASAS